MKTFYYITNICDHDIDIAGEILVVFDGEKKPIWHHDWSDSVFDFPEHLPRDLMKEHGASFDSKFISFDYEDTKFLKIEIEKYLKSHGCQITEDY